MTTNPNVQPISYAQTPQEVAHEIINNIESQKALREAQDLHTIHNIVRKALKLRIGVNLSEHVILVPGPCEKLPSINEVTIAISHCIPTIIPVTEADIDYWNEEIAPNAGEHIRGEIIREIRLRKIANNWAPGYSSNSPLIHQAESH